MADHFGLSARELERSTTSLATAAFQYSFPPVEENGIREFHGTSSSRTADGLGTSSETVAIDVEPFAISDYSRDPDARNGRAYRHFAKGYKLPAVIDHRGVVLARLLAFPNVLVTGHQASFTQETLQAIAETTQKNVCDIEETGRSENEVTSRLIKGKL